MKQVSSNLRSLVQSTRTLQLSFKSSNAVVAEHLHLKSGSGRH